MYINFFSIYYSVRFGDQDFSKFWKYEAIHLRFQRDVQSLTFIFLKYTLDPDFGGRDWNQIRDLYFPLVHRIGR